MEVFIRKTCINFMALYVLQNYYSSHRSFFASSIFMSSNIFHIDHIHVIELEHFSHRPYLCHQTFFASTIFMSSNSNIFRIDHIYVIEHFSHRPFLCHRLIHCIIKFGKRYMEKRIIHSDVTFIYYKLFNKEDMCLLCSVQSGW